MLLTPRATNKLSDTGDSGIEYSVQQEGVLCAAEKSRPFRTQLCHLLPCELITGGLSFLICTMGLVALDSQSSLEDELTGVVTGLARCSPNAASSAAAVGFCLVLESFILKEKPS